MIGVTFKAPYSNHTRFIGYPACCLYRALSYTGRPRSDCCGPEANETTLNRIRAEMGLDLPVHTRFVNYSLKICKGDFGESVISESGFVFCSKSSSYINLH